MNTAIDPRELKKIRTSFRSAGVDRPAVQRYRYIIIFNYCNFLTRYQSGPGAPVGTSDFRCSLAGFSKIPTYVGTLKKRIFKPNNEVNAVPPKI